jgi:hypothetical protein
MTRETVEDMMDLGNLRPALQAALNINLTTAAAAPQ